MSWKFQSWKPWPSTPCAGQPWSMPPQSGIHTRLQTWRNLTKSNAVDQGLSPETTADQPEVNILLKTYSGKTSKHQEIPQSSNPVLPNNKQTSSYPIRRKPFYCPRSRGRFHVLTHKHIGYKLLPTNHKRLELHPDKTRSSPSLEIFKSRLGELSR